MISHCGTLLNLPALNVAGLVEVHAFKGASWHQQMENKATAEGCNEESIDT